MTFVNYSEWRSNHLLQHWLDIDNHRFAFWTNRLQSNRVTLLFVHGITGDHNGLVPLAREFDQTHNIVLLELPGHGESAELNLESARVLQNWFHDVLYAIEQTVVSVDAIIAHSFGCSAVIRESSSDIILICPVPTPSRLYSQYARIIQRFAPFWALFYSWKMFVWLRGATLLKVNNREARHRVRWVGFQARATYRQIIYQARLADIILDNSSYDIVSKRVKLVLTGMEDTTARERDTAQLAEVFPNSFVEILRGGHLLPVESPERVAERIKLHIAS